MAEKLTLIARSSFRIGAEHQAELGIDRDGKMPHHVEKGSQFEIDYLPKDVRQQKLLAELHAADRICKATPEIVKRISEEIDGEKKALKAANLASAPGPNITELVNAAVAAALLAAGVKPAKS